MKKKLLFLIGAFALAGGTRSAPLGTAFTYQGQLDHGGQPASGTYQIFFSLHEGPSGGPVLGLSSTNIIAVSNGLFAVELDLGSAIFNGQERWLETNVRTNVVPVINFTTLSPRRRITPVPYALYAATAGTVSNAAIRASQLATIGAPAEAGQVLGYNGASLVWTNVPGTLAGAWSLSGNTLAAGTFLGTLNNAPLEVRVNNSRALRVEPNGMSPNLVGGWSGNTTDPGASGGTIAGGGTASVLGTSGSNRVADHFCTVSGGANNLAGLPNGDFQDAWFASIGGGYFNRAEGVASTIGGGSANRTSGNDTTVGGGWRNEAVNLRATVSGGEGNVGSGAYSAIGGGVNNRAEGVATVVGGGSENRATNNNSIIAGGYRNYARGRISTVGGGEQNQALADYSTIGGGLLNQVTGTGSATVSGGNGNTASGNGATVPGGDSNLAQGRNSFAAGRGARALHDGSFVWADRQGLGALVVPFASTADNQFAVRALGGALFESRFLEVVGEGSERAYIGGDGVGNEVHVGSLNPEVDTVAIYNSGASRWMNLTACSITILGGCDLAEPFPMKEETIEKGSVVVIDDERPGYLKRSTLAYDRRVAGIVSGAYGVNPGIALKQQGVLDQGENVALTGRVYVKADASFTPIKPGDLLTTSDNPGHAMAVTDHARAQGAILGKAMSTLKEGTGLVLVLVTLQ